jgi:ELWxxDGT repeat protein
MTGRVARYAGRQWASLAFAFSGGFVGFVAGEVLGPLTGEARIDGSHIKTATLGVLLAGFGWLAGVVVAMVLTPGTPPPSRSMAWALRGLALGFVIAGVLIARRVPSLDHTPPATTIIPLQGAIRLDAVLAAATCLALAQRRVFRRTAVAGVVVASIAILAVVAGRFPTGGVYVSNLTAVGGTLLFTVNGELWTSDGTPAGTAQVGGFDGFATELTGVGETLVVAGLGETDGELWASDGTEAGTVLLKDIGPGSDARQLTRAGGELFFVAGDGASGAQLWKTDATETGTLLVKEFDTRLAGLRNIGGTLYFRVWGPGSDSQLDSHLWTSDGTEAGTHVVRVQPSGAWGRSEDSVTIGGSEFFVARDKASGRELWVSDGTQTGTTLVKDIYPGREGSRPRELRDLGGTLLFRARDGTGSYGLWASDGTEAGTVRLRFDASGPRTRDQSITNVGGTLFFTADEGQLWKTGDQGTVMVQDPSPGSDWSGWTGPNELTNVRGTLFFVTSDGFSGVELWASDGTEAGTTSVARWSQRELIGRLVGRWGV